MNSAKLVQIAAERDYRPAWRGAENRPDVPDSLPDTEPPSLIELLETALDEAAWDAFSNGSAIRRAGRAGFARNGCVGLGNWSAAEVADDEGLGQPLGRGLHGIGEAEAPLLARAQELLEARRVLRRRDDQDVPDARQHEGAEGHRSGRPCCNRAPRDMPTSRTRRRPRWGCWTASG
jgi:hypothetical protein